MPYVYNTKYFDGITLKQLLPKRDAIHTYVLPDGLVIGVFQGNISALDVIIRVLQPGVDLRPESPPHMYWVVDLLLKIESFKTEVREIIEYYINFYDNCSPFTTDLQRSSYKLQTLTYITSKYSHVKQPNTGILDYVAIILEWFSINEKQNIKAFMFRQILTTFLDYIDGKVSFMKLLYHVENPY